MSSDTSQDNLYKNKCLYTVFNILYAKIQRLEEEVHKLKCDNKNKQSTNQIEKIIRRIDMVELKQKTISKNKSTSNTNNITNGENNTLSALDMYLSDVNDMIDLQLDDNEIKKLMNNEDEDNENNKNNKNNKDNKNI